MDHPFLVGFIVLAVVAVIGYGVERFRSWAAPLAALSALALIADALVRALT